MAKTVILKIDQLLSSSGNALVIDDTLNQLNNHAHDDLYYTESEMDAKLSDAVTASQTFTMDQINQLKGGAGSAFDTLKELEGYIAANQGNITTVMNGLVSKADVNHNHDTAYYTKAQIDYSFSQAAPKSHDHNAYYYTKAQSDSIVGGRAMKNGAPTEDFYGKNIFAAGDIVANYSDDRLKGDKETLNGLLELIEKLEVFRFKPNERALELGAEDREEIGVSAQQIQEIFPELIRLSPLDRNQLGESRSGEDYQTVQYDRLAVLALGAIKELVGILKRNNIL